MRELYWNIAHLRFYIRFYHSDESVELLRDELLRPAEVYTWYGIARNENDEGLSGLLWTSACIAEDFETCLFELQEKVESSLLKMQIIEEHYWITSFDSEWTAIQEQTLNFADGVDAIQNLSQKQRDIFFGIFKASSRLEINSKIIFLKYPRALAWQSQIYLADTSERT